MMCCVVCMERSSVEAGARQQRRAAGRVLARRVAALLAGSALVAATPPATAQDATWLANPGSGSFGSGANWSTGTVPTGTAFFGGSNTTALSLPAVNTTIGGWTFNAGASSYTFTSGGNLFFDGAGVVVAGGSVTIQNNVNNSIFFNNASTAGSATIVNNGLVNFFNASTGGTAQITNNHGLTFFDTSTAANATIINNDIINFNGSSSAGAATIFNTANSGNTGGLLFNHDSTAGNANIISNTFLGFTSDASAGNATITNNSGGLIRFANTSSGGTARFITAAGSAIDLSLLSSAGTTAGSIEGGGSVFLGSKGFAVGGNNLSTIFSGTLQDGGMLGGVGGSLTKTGLGTLTLSGINAYSGATVVDAGTLIVNGSIASSPVTTVSSGGTLGGAGTVGSVVVAGGGTLAPGSAGAPGALAISGNLTFQPGAVYSVQTHSPSIANVSGSATLTGAGVQAALGPGSYTLGQTFVILHAAGGLGGTSFSGLSVNPPNFTAGLSSSVDDKNVLLTITGATLGVGSAFNGNQQSVANAVNGFFNQGGTLTPGFSTIFGLTGGALASVLTQLSGEAATGAQQGAFQLGSQFMGLMLDPLVDGGSGRSGGGVLGFAPERQVLPDEIALAYAKVTKAPYSKAPPALVYASRWNVWGGAFGGTNRTRGDIVVAGSHDVSTRTAGVAAGLDYRLAPGTVAGFALAGGGTRWDLTQGLGGGRSDAFQAGAYVVTRAGPAYLAAAAAFSNYWMSTERIAPFGSRLTADLDAPSFGGRLEGGYRIGTPATGITPYAALQAQRFHTPSYRESDATNGGFGLAYDARTGTDTRSELGARFEQVAALDRDTVLTLRGRLAWAHDRVSNPDLAAVFQALPGAGFVVNGALPAKDAVLASGGAEWRLASGLSLVARLDGEVARRVRTYTGTGMVRYEW